jgi:hypothetical protein
MFFRPMLAETLAQLLVFDQVSKTQGEFRAHTYTRYDAVDRVTRVTRDATQGGFLDL